MNNRKSFQVELWQECNSLCKFCYLGSENRKTSEDIKIKVLSETLKIISDPTFSNEYAVISYLGGEFFQGQLNTPEIRDLFMQVLSKTAELLNTNKIQAVWLYATLTIGEQEDLYETLKLFNNHKNFWILTSYDTKGRFHTDKMEKNWDKHMLQIHTLYPDIKFNITSILSKDLIEKYMNDEFSFKKMMEKYNAQFFLKQCGKGSYTKEQFIEAMPWFFPTRTEFLEFLSKFKREESEEMWTKLFDIHYRADNLYRNYNADGHQMELNIRNKNSKQEERVADEIAELNTCGHLMNYAAYSDCESCVLCDKQLIDSL